MTLEIRSGAPARPAPEAGDADPTHGSSDFQAFLQSDIGGLRAHGRLKDFGKPFADMGNRLRISSGNPNFICSNCFEDFWETMRGSRKPFAGSENPANRLRPVPQQC